MRRLLRRLLAADMAARLVILAGCAALAGGVAMLFGLGWATIAGGFELVIYGLLFIDDGRPPPVARKEAKR